MAQAITGVMAWLGGIWTMLQVLAWLFWRRPKLKGDIERKIVRQTLGPEKSQYAELLLRVYVVNTRMQPTTERAWLLVLRRFQAVYREYSRPGRCRALRSLTGTGIAG